MASSAPRTIKALAAYGPGLEVKPFEYTSRPLGDHDVEIAISHCGICGSDIHTISGYRGTAHKWPVVPGHEMVGHITAAGPGVSNVAVGDRVGVGAMVFSCQNKEACNACRNDDDPLCPHVVFTYNSLYANGDKTYGGYADYIRVDANYAFRIPDEIPSDLAASLLCAGVTVFKPLKAYVRPGMRVGVVGIGGLGHMGIKFVKALDATPVAFSHSSSKKQDAADLGAEGFVDLSNPEDVASAAQSVDVLLVTAGNHMQPYDTYLRSVKQGGTLIMVGVPTDKIQITAFVLLTSKVSVVGSAIGGIKDTQEMLALAAKKKVFPVIQKMPMREAKKGIALVEEGKARFRVVLENEA